jgi:hypothetical protein
LSGQRPSGLMGYRRGRLICGFAHGFQAEKFQRF